MKKYMLALGLSLLTVLGLFTGCSPKAETASDSDSLKIVATIFPEYDWVRQVLGDRAGEVQLTPAARQRYGPAQLSAHSGGYAHHRGV